MQPNRIQSLEEYSRASAPTPKARGLVWLRQHGAAVPEAMIWRAEACAQPLAAAFAELDQNAAWAVRSSSSAEDGGEASHAGQYLTLLSVSGSAALVDACAQVISSLTSARADSYAERRGQERATDIDVIIQRMITPRLAGVAFSRNPVTGLNEVVIEAVEGLGEALVGGGVTPRRWVWRGGDFTEQPDDDGEHGALIAQIVAETRRLAREFGKPADLEWAYDGELWFLQIRPITGLESVRVYSNRISREVMPGLIKPLVWSINVPLVNAAWIRLIERVVGPSGLTPSDLARQFAFRSYFSASALGGVFELMGMPYDSLEMMLGLPNTPRPRMSLSGRTLALLPRMLGMGVHLLGYERHFLAEHDSCQRAFAAVDTDVAGISDDELDQLFDALRADVGRAAELNIVAPLLANAFGAWFRRAATRLGVDPAQIDMTDGSAAAHLNPADGLRVLHDLLQAHGIETDREIQLAALPDEVHAALDDFLARYGHFSDSGNDISIVPWRETPEKVLRLAAGSPPAVNATAKIAYADLRRKAGVFKRPVLDFIYRRAHTFQAHRETISSTYTYGYGLLRPLALEYGRRLVAAGVIITPDDVMFLSIEEARTHLRDRRDLRAEVAARRADYARSADLVMPETIYGDDFTPLPPAGAQSELSGTGTSRGQHQGRLRLLRSSDDFSTVEAGDIIVIPYSDVGWTPAFAKAGAVVAEAGGMLSHSSIVAREYGIPCVVSVTGAMQLPDGAQAIVDGLTGRVVLVEDDA